MPAVIVPGESPALLRGGIGRARQAVLQARRIVNPVTHDELTRIADVWVETALMLSSRDLRRMRHLAMAQDRRWAALQAR